jgi:hypothetical protein
MTSVASTVYSRLTTQEENYCKELEAMRVWPLPGPNGG